VQCCLENPEVKELAKQGRIKVLTFGIPDPEVKDLGIGLVNLGKIVSDEELSVIYSASDIFILHPGKIIYPTRSLKPCPAAHRLSAFAWAEYLILSKTAGPVILPTG